MLKTRTELDYPFFSAGRFWLVQELTITVLPDGTEGISQAESDRIHRAVANQICGAAADLSWDEFEFLCDLTGTLHVEVARHLGLHKSTVSRWRPAGRVPHLASLALKRWFWLGLFGDLLKGWRLPVAQFGDDTGFLARARQRAIDQRLVEEVVPQAA